MRIHAAMAASLCLLLSACSNDNGGGSPNGATDASGSGQDGATLDSGAADGASDDTAAGDTTADDTGAGGDTSAEDTSGDAAADTSTTDTTPTVAPDPTDGDLFCLVDEPAADTLWIYGSGKRCYAVKRPVPWDPSYATNESLACTSLLVNGVTATGQWVDACPSDDIVGVCPAIQLANLPYWQGWRTQAFIYRSPITPDVDAIARNILSVCETQDGAALAPDGSARRAVCSGTATATFAPSDGPATEQTLTVPLCSYKRIGDRIEYNIRIIADQGLASQRALTLRVTRQAGEFDRVGGLGTPVGLFDLGGFWQTATGVTQGLDVTSFDENGAGLRATFDLQMSDLLNPARTATMQGTLQVEFPAGTP